MSIGTVYETAYKGDFNQVKVKIDENKLLLETPDTNNRLLLHWAALGGNENLVEYLIDLGSPVNPLDDTNSTPLTLAASAGRLEVARLLIGKGADVNHKTNRGQTPLHYACSKGHKEIANILILAGANINDADVLGATPLHRAAAQGRTEIVHMILCQHNAGLIIDACDSTACTPLHLACEEGWEALSCMLVNAGFSLHVLNKEKKTPLDYCSDQLKRLLLRISEATKIYL